MSEMQTKLQELLKGFLDEGQEMIDPTTPIATLGLESIRIMEFMLDVEDHYDCLLYTSPSPRDRG